MADKTEKATPKRRDEARQKGQVAKSMDLGGAGVLLAGLMALGAFGPKILISLQNQLSTSLKAAADPSVVGGAGLGRIVMSSVHTTFGAIVPIAGTCAIAAAVIMAAQVGLKITPKAIKPDIKKLNPLANAKQVFGPNALVELVKNVAKVSAVGIVVWLVIKPQVDQVGTLVGMEPEALGNQLLSAVMKIGKAAAVAYFAIGVADYIWQKHKLDKSIKMDKQEIKDEFKSSELPPEVRMAMKRRQMTASRARMMAAIPDADVVVTNPTHYAVALKYDAEKGGAPLLLAKGNDFLALKIREIAVANNVMLLESPALARSIYYSTELDEEIPGGLYLAVAQVLAYVYQIRQYRAGKGKRPDPLKDDLPIPPDLRRDS